MRDTRLGDEERASLVAALRRHVSEGRLTLEEFEERVGLVFAASTRSDADEAFVDLPLLAAEPTSPSRGRHGETDEPAPHWRPTDEVFRDPTTGRVMRVWLDPLDGSRHYVPG